jgi:hypothetical protein
MNLDGVKILQKAIHVFETPICSISDDAGRHQQEMKWPEQAQTRPFPNDESMTSFLFFGDLEPSQT